MPPAQDSGANRDDRAMTRLVPWSFALLAWHQVIQLFLSFYPKALGPLIPEVWWYLLGAGSMALILLALLLPMNLRRDGLSVADLGFTSQPRPIDCVRAIAAGACIWLAAQALLRLGSALTGGAKVNVSALLDMKEAMGSLGSLGLGELFGLLFPMIVLAPFIEEILYRGVVITSLRACWGESPRKNLLAAGVSGFIFSIVHGLGHPFYYGVYFLIGMAFACFYQRTRSLTAVMIAHAVFNILPPVKVAIMGLLATCGMGG